MDTDSKQKMQHYLNARREHPAWRLLAATSGPGVLSCLQLLFEEHKDGVDIDSALVALADVLQWQATSEGLEIADTDKLAAARKELRLWIKRELVVERQGKVIATDALQKALLFVDGLDNPLMTSTASRLSTVQREIENLEANLNPNPKMRIANLERKIKALEQERDAAKAGRVRVLEGSAAIENIRDVYHLATSLRADFRRVEDSYRDADKHLRQSIISEQQHRGEVVDKLLDSHDHLLNTAEGRVFHNFHQQLSRSIELNEMNTRLKTILKHPQCLEALDRRQQQEMRWLKLKLVDESATVIKARARSERDVKSFLKTGLANEHHRVGQLLQELFSTALDVDWSSASVRRTACSLPPVAISCAGLPLIERLRFKTIDDDQTQILDFSTQTSSLNEIDTEFWASFDSLDRQQLLDDTLALLQQRQQPLSIAELAEYFSPNHDLESISLWLSMAREAALPIDHEFEQFELHNSAGERLRYRVPKLTLSIEALANI
ncbi:MAG: DUF3375 domain-containing protein, partial [Spongiibacteraceae bacterium]|nr:DUF3375 domain-containing protein [Spongiibacteraceae bacterium]